jgi:hypothetical protein
MFKQQHNMRKEYTRKIFDFSSDSWVLLLQWCSHLLFAWDKFFIVLRDVWDEMIHFPFDPCEKTLLEFKFALPGLIITVRNSGHSSTGSTALGLRSAILIITVRNSIHKVLFTWFLRASSIHLAPRFIPHVDVLVQAPLPEIQHKMHQYLELDIKIKGINSN